MKTARNAKELFMMVIEEFKQNFIYLSICNFFQANHFYCEKCVAADQSILSTNSRLDSSYNFIGVLDTINESTESKSTLNTLLNDEDLTFKNYTMFRQELFESYELTRSSFEEEFATLIINSTCENPLEAETSRSLSKNNKEFITIDSLSKFSTK